MKILLIAPSEALEAMEIDGSLETMQALVGGLIQVIYPFQEPVALVCNDEGKPLHLPPNRVLRDPECFAEDFYDGMDL